MREVFTEIEIQAPAGLVWDILTSLEKYHEWNPFIRHSEGRAELGCRLTCRPTMPNGSTYTFHPIVTRMSPGREFAWKGGVLLPGLADGEHIFEIEPLDEGRVRCIHRQEFSGLLIPLLWWKMAPQAREGFQRMNQALKEQAEKAACP